MQGLERVIDPEIRLVLSKQTQRDLDLYLAQQDGSQAEVQSAISKRTLDIASQVNTALLSVPGIPVRYEDVRVFAIEFNSLVSAYLQMRDELATARKRNQDLINEMIKSTFLTDRHNIGWNRPAANLRAAGGGSIDDPARIADAMSLLTRNVKVECGFR